MSDRENASLLDGNSSGRPKSGIETDSGRGDSSSETHCAKLEASSIIQFVFYSLCLPIPVYLCLCYVGFVPGAPIAAQAAQLHAATCCETDYVI